MFSMQLATSTHKSSVHIYMYMCICTCILYMNTCTLYTVHSVIEQGNYASRQQTNFDMKISGKKELSSGVVACICLVSITDYSCNFSAWR